MTTQNSNKLVPTKFLQIIASIVLFMIGTPARSQDLIVSNKGDSIHCQITEIKTDHIRYTHVEDNEVVKAFIPVAWVVSYQQNFYPFSEIELLLAAKQQEQQAQSIIKAKEAREREAKKGDVQFAWLMSVGWSKRIAGLKNKGYDEETLAYAQALQSGWNLGLDMFFPTSLRNGFGLKYSAFFSPYAGDFVIYTHPTGASSTITIKSTVWIHYLAPTFNASILNADSTRAVMLGFGIGYLHYSEHTDLDPPINTSGSHFAFNWDIGYAFAMKKAASPFVRLSLCIGNLITAKVEQGSSTISGRLRTPENLSRIDISVGVKLNEKK